MFPDGINRISMIIFKYPVILLILSEVLVEYLSALSSDLYENN